MRGNYKDRTRMPHAVLADRIAERDPGNKPQSNDRIAYAYIETKYLKCKLCYVDVDLDRCKCRLCLGMFCSKHLMNHREKCRPMCRLSGETNPSKLIKCNTCRAYYSIGTNDEGDSYFKSHKKQENKETNEISYNKCKKPLSESILQGDIVESPDYIEKNSLSIDYLFYITNQIMKPSLQFLELIAHNPEKLFESYITRELNRRQGKKPLTYYFQQHEDGEEYSSHKKFKSDPKLDGGFKIISINKKSNRKVKNKVQDIESYEESPDFFKVAKRDLDFGDFPLPMFIKPKSVQKANKKNMKVSVREIEKKGKRDITDELQTGFD